MNYAPVQRFHPSVKFQLNKSSFLDIFGLHTYQLSSLLFYAEDSLYFQLSKLGPFHFDEF